MAKWIMPHEITGEEVLPMNAAPNWIMPHDVEAAKAAEKTPEQLVLEQESPATRVGIGAGKMATDVVRGTKQTAGKLGRVIGIENTLPEDVATEIKSERGAREAIAQDPYAQGGELASQLGLGLAAPGARPLQAALYGGLLEGPLKGRENPTFGNMLTEGGQGALVGGVGGGLTHYLTSGLGKTKNALAGRFADPLEQNRFRIFKENKVPFSLGDITQGNGALALEDTIKHIPFSGRKDFLQGQSNSLGEVIKEAPERIAGVVPGASKEDLNTAIAKSVKDKYAQVKGAARSMYDDVEARVQAVGNPPITPTKMSTEVNNLLTKYPSAFAKLGDDPETVSTLQTIASGVKPGKSPILNVNGQPILTPPNLTFAEMRQLDSDLGAMIRQGRLLTGRGELNNKSFDQLVKVQTALRKDIEDWSATVGDPMISKGVSDANKYFRESVVPFRKNKTTRDIVQDNLTPEQMDNLANRMFKIDAPATSDQSVSFMTPEGVQAGRYHLIKQAEAKAMDDALSSGYSPNRFLKQSQLGESGGKLFSPNELGQLADLQELVRSGKRAAGYAFNPPTGASLWGAIAGKVPAIPALASVANKATTSEPAMRFMLSDPRLYTGSGALGQAGESMLRKSGIGPALSTIDDQ